MKNQLIKEQFNKQAENFANWAVGKNVVYLKAYFDFCEMAHNDILLDVACGPGEFTMYCADKIAKAYGVDISDKEIEIAERASKLSGIRNILFDCSDVEKLPYNDNFFSVVTCKSAFHHFIHPEIVLREMKRCCTEGGKISLQDIVSYENSYVTNFFDAFDKLVDISHNRVLSIAEINQLFLGHKITKTKEFTFEVDLNVKEYLGHAVQEPENLLKINDLLMEGLKDKTISKCLFKKEGELYFKRFGYLILGKK